jgi:transglutaminase-like putative cysteine protease
MITRLFRCALAAFALMAAGAQAADQDDQPVVSKIAHVTYDVEKDGRSVRETTMRLKVQQERGLEMAKTFSFSFSTSIETGEVLEAYTLKQNGRKIAVPAGNYQRTTNQGRGRAGPFFSDRTTINVEYPDVAVGDSVHVRYRTTEKEPMFPGQFSAVLRYSHYAVLEDVRVTVRAPKDMPLRQQSHFMTFSESDKQGKHVMEWRFSNLKPRERSEEDDEGLWSVKEIPGLLVSTFPSYEAIAKAYGARALPKAAPTPRIRELASSIVGSETEPRQKARKLYEWVSRNLTYGGNCIGVGAVVPRDLDVVLDNKMGDCKDHATLLQALLTAASIPSEQVLVNAGSDYELPDIPVVAMVNHVFNYLPTLDMYLDATAKDIPFGYLPSRTYAKPVIHVEAAKALAQVPGFDHLSKQQQLTLQLKIADNGSASGSMQVKVKGAEAASMRAHMRELKGQEQRDFVKSALGYYGYRARGTFETSDLQALGDEFDYTIKFDIDNYLRSAAATGSLPLGPVMSTPFSVLNFSDMEDRPASKRRQICSGFHSSERYEIELPAGMELLSIPDNADLKGTLVDYQASYQRSGNQLTVTRRLDDKSPGGICEPDLYAQFLKQAVPVGENLRMQVLYKRKRGD